MASVPIEFGERVAKRARKVKVSGAGNASAPGASDTVSAVGQGAAAAEGQELLLTGSDLYKSKQASPAVSLQEEMPSTTSQGPAALVPKSKTPSGKAASSLQNRVDEIVSAGARDPAYTGASLIASIGDSVVARGGWGAKGHGDFAADPVDVGTVFDFDAMTSSLCSATLLMRLVDSGRLGLDERACRYIQALGVGQKALITISHLLSHTSGLPPAPSLYGELTRANAGARLGILSSSGAKQYAYSQFLKMGPKYEPGTRRTISDINSILAGNVCEVVTGLPLDRAFHRYIAAPLQLKSVGFIDVAMLRRKHLAPVTDLFMPAGECPSRGKVVAGEVWDENAYVMGGVAGHAGLFGTVADLHAWGVELVRAWHGESPLVRQETVHKFWSPVHGAFKGEARLGLEIPTAESGLPDVSVTSEAAWTVTSLGSSLYMEPRSRTVIAFLTNGGFSGAPSRRLQEVRAEIHSVVQG